MCIFTFMALWGRYLYFHFLKDRETEAFRFQVQDPCLRLRFSDIRILPISAMLRYPPPENAFNEPRESAQKGSCSGQQEVGVVVWRKKKKPDTCWTQQPNKNERDKNESVDTKTKRRMCPYLLHKVYVTLFTKHSTARTQSCIWNPKKVSVGQMKGSSTSLRRYYS